MDYLSVKVEEAHFYESTVERKAFRDHLKKVAKALHAIEWNDSGDGADDENEAIRECLSEEDIIQTFIGLAQHAAERSQRVTDQLQRLINDYYQKKWEDIQNNNYVRKVKDS